jgi:hypothetical protein
MMTYAERELIPLGFGVVSKMTTPFAENVVLSYGHLKLRFDCSCPSYPHIKALGCPLHHEGPGSSWPIKEAKKIASAIKLI